MRKLIYSAAFLLVSSVLVAAPDFKITPVPDGKFRVFKKLFSQHINVYGVRVFGTEKTPPVKLQHVAIVLAEYLDNNEDGRPDNPTVHAELVRRDAFMAVTETERAMERLDHDVFQNAGFHAGQGQFATETNPGGQRFDATLEEVLHLITHVGYANAYPKIFGERPGTELAKCLDLARGGYFRRVPRRYPKGAWFTYDDHSCDYGCQCTEYLYWAITSVLGAQQAKHRREDIAHEWTLYNRDLVRKRDPGIYKLITDPRYMLPTRLPNGKYEVK